MRCDTIFLIPLPGHLVPLHLLTPSLCCPLTETIYGLGWHRCSFLKFPRILMFLSDTIFFFFSYTWIWESVYIITVVRFPVSTPYSNYAGYLIITTWLLIVCLGVPEFPFKSPSFWTNSCALCLFRSLCDIKQHGGTRYFRVCLHKDAGNYRS